MSHHKVIQGLTAETGVSLPTRFPIGDIHSNRSLRTNRIKGKMTGDHYELPEVRIQVVRQL